MSVPLRPEPARKYERLSRRARFVHVKNTCSLQVVIGAVKFPVSPNSLSLTGDAAFSLNRILK
jgi:hypothetical protein